MKTAVGLMQLLLIVACVVFYIRMAIGRKALQAGLDVWREIPQRPATRVMLGLWLAVFLIDLVETKVDHLFTQALGVDFTPVVHAFEGDAVAALQAWRSVPLTVPFTYLLTFAYLILFPALLFGSAHAYDRLDDVPRLRMTAYVYALNYLLCLPFYLFVPVLEPWMTASGVIPLMDDHVHPWLIDLLRPMSGIDNCFPSYHTSLSVSLVLIAREAGPSRFARVATWTGALIVLSTVYLGFHWLSDVLSGVAFGVVAYVVARRAALAGEPVPVAVGESSRS